MPILQAASPDAPLEQGDILDGVFTAVGTPTGPAGNQGMVLVVSRNCVAVRAKEVVVARVAEKALQGLSLDGSFDALVSEFVAVRDGEAAIASFYLGEMPCRTASSRFIAKLDALYTTAVPAETGQRRDYIAAHRIASLAPAFAHDLHQRLFRAFASMGFDDSAWWTDADLKLVVNRGEAELLKLRSEVLNSESIENVAAVAGAGSKAARMAKAALADAPKRLSELEEKLEPLRVELQRRKLV